MNDKLVHTAYLLKKYLDNDLQPGEKDELDSWLNEEPGNRQLLDRIDSQQNLVHELKLFYNADTDVIGKKINAVFPGMTSNENIVQDSSKNKIHLLKTTWFRYAAAVILILGACAYFWNINKKSASSLNELVISKNDVPPGSYKAMLTLSDGRQVELTDQAKNIKEAGTEIHNTNGKLEYGKTGSAVFNTMSTPRGGQYRLVLPDGTNVWLNAASSITYPTAFTKNTREVSVKGEVYLEVAKKPKQPFIVKTPKEIITVLGTGFNVNVYADEPAGKISLADGAIKVENILLKPGHAYVNGKMIQTNIEQDIAWKNGVFNFNDLTGEQAMRQLARWYDIEVKYEGNIKDVKFGGGLDRSLTLRQVLRGLEGIGGLHFNIEGNTVIVKR